MQENGLDLHAGSTVGNLCPSYMQPVSQAPIYLSYWKNRKNNFVLTRLFLSILSHFCSFS